MATYGNPTGDPTAKPVDLPSKRAIWIGLSFILFLVALIFIFFVAAGHIERRNYYQPNNQSPTAPAPAPAPLGP